MTLVKINFQYFQVNELFDYKYVGIPITFKNTKPHCQGLIDYKSNPEGYTAEKY